MRNTRSPKGLIPGGAAKKGRVLREDRWAALGGRGTVLPCKSPALRDARVLSAYRRICEAFPLRLEAALVALAAAKIEIELEMFLGKAEKVHRDRAHIQRLMAALASNLLKLTTLYAKPHEVVPQ